MALNLSGHISLLKPTMTTIYDTIWCHSAIMNRCSCHHIPAGNFKHRHGNMSLKLSTYIYGIHHAINLEPISSKWRPLYQWIFNPLGAKYFWVKLAIYFIFYHFLILRWSRNMKSFLVEDKDLFVSMSWLLMTWWCKEPGHQQPWYWSRSLWMFWL